MKLTPIQKKTMVGLGLVSVILGGTYFSYVVITNYRKKKEAKNNPETKDIPIENVAQTKDIEIESDTENKNNE